MRILNPLKILSDDYKLSKMRRGADLAALRLMDVKVVIAAGRVDFLLQFSLQPHQLIRDLMLKGGGGLVSPFAFGGFAVG